MTTHPTPDGIHRLQGHRARVAAGVAGAAALLGLALTVPMYLRLEEGLRVSARNAVQVLADGVARQLVEDLTNRQREMVLMSEMVCSHAAPDGQVLRKAMNGLRGQQAEYAWIGLTDARGHVVAALDGLLEGVDASKRPWFAAGLRGGFVGDPHDAVLLARYLAPRPNGEPPRFLDVVAPMRDDKGVVHGVMAGHLHWDWVHQVITETVARYRGSRPIEVFVANRKGDWLLDLASPQKLPTAPLKDLQAESGYVVAVQRLATAPLADSLGWTVVVREDADLAYAPLYELRRLMLAFSVLVTALALLLAWLLVSRAWRPGTVPGGVVDGFGAAPAPGSPLAAPALAGAALDRMARNDRLTGLPNRGEVLARLQQAILRAQTGSSCGALLLVDLDDFGELNQSRGLEVGDQILILAAGRLRRLEGMGTLAARGGGDKFLVLVEEAGSDPARGRERATVVAGAALAALREPFVLQAGACLIQASIGIALVGDGSATVDELLHGAEQAMRQAKQQGKDRAVVFE